IIPTVEALDRLSQSKHVGVVATPGTILSRSYAIETAKLFPHIHVNEVACPMWVPLIENNEANGPGADYFVEKYCREVMSKDPLIDTLLLGCTHYPLLYNKIRKAMPDRVSIIPQGQLVADSLADYLRRHPEIEQCCSRSGHLEFLTTENPSKFDSLATLFLDTPVSSTRIQLT
ncbi:MAG: glutamate racemase, partial [Muribaculaceae bacterium]|nr:glutamate racemase [Muribaculaceae bacterium]